MTLIGHRSNFEAASSGLERHYAGSNGFNAAHASPRVEGVSGYNRTVLENGVRVVTESISSVRSISIGVLVGCGSVQETPAQAGLSHLCEHLLFQGTSGRDALQIARQIDSAGGMVGAFTTRDYTCYHGSILDDYCYHALDLLGDVLLNSTFPERSLEREKHAILSEMARGQDVPEQRVDELVKGAAWAGHGLGRAIAGDAAAIARHTREDVIYFFHEHYTPQRIIIAAAGNLDHDDFVAQTRDSFWRLLGENLPAAVQAPEFHGGITLSEADFGQAYFALAIPAPPYADPMRYGVHLLNRVLGDGISSRLFRVLREERGLVYEIRSEYHAYRDAGMLTVEGSTAVECLPEVIEQVLATVGNLFRWTEPVDSEELWRAKTQIRSQHLVGSEDVHTRMCRLSTQELYFGGFLDARRVLADIDAVDLAALRGVASDYFAGEMRRAHLVVAGPVAGHAELRERLNGLMDGLRFESVKERG